MNIFIMRHGSAVSHADSDSTRALTSQGKKEGVQAGEWIQAQVTHIEKALVSPYKRAKETLEMVKSVISIASEDENKGLTPSGKSKTILEELYILAEQGVESVLVVSHLPLIGNIASGLCPSLNVPMMSTSSVAYISLDKETKETDWIDYYAG